MATNLKGFPQIVGQDVFSNSATQQLPLGVYAETSDGRGFRYALVGAVSTVAGNVYQSPAQDTTNYNPSGGLSISAAAAGSTTITLTSSVTIALNALAGGLVMVNVGTGVGQTFKIYGNTAVSGATGCVITLEDPIRVALDTSSKIDLKVNPYNGIIVAPSTMTGEIVGVASSIITNGYYGWIQTRGLASCLFTGTGTAGTAVGVLQGGTIGSLAPAIAGTPIVGHCAGTVITGEYGAINLTLG
jgi:hypothetical protein